MVLERNIILRRARLIDPQSSLDEVADIKIVGGVIKEIGRIDSAKGESIDLKGKIITPGLYDMHVHLREPGREDEETIETGCAAAAAGGFTGVACLPNTAPPIDTAGIIDFILRRAINLPVKVNPVAAITQGRAGKNLTDMHDLLGMGAVGFSDDGAPLADSDLMRRALEYASDLGAVIIQHSEDPYLFKGSMHEGLVSTKLGLAGIPSLCEEIMVMRDIRLAEYTGGRLHVAHVSAAETVEHLRNAKDRGVKVTAEVTPHHLFLTAEAVVGYNTNAKMNPPLRTERDRQALIEGLLEGTIDAIATDHAPHAPEEKEDDFNSAPFGVIGLETALGLVLTELVHTGKMDWNMLVRRMAVKPREILRLPEVKISVGSEAELSIIDPDLEWEVNPDDFKSLSHNTPFAGRKLKGCAFGIYNKGQLAVGSRQSVKGFGSRFTIS